MTTVAAVAVSFFAAFHLSCHGYHFQWPDPIIVLTVGGIITTIANLCLGKTKRRKKRKAHAGKPVSQAPPSTQVERRTAQAKMIMPRVLKALQEGQSVSMLPIKTKSSTLLLWQYLGHDNAFLLDEQIKVPEEDTSRDPKTYAAATILALILNGTSTAETSMIFTMQDNPQANELYTKLIENKISLEEALKHPFLR